MSPGEALTDKVKSKIIEDLFIWINPAKKETPHSFKGQQLENKWFYLVVIYIAVWGNFLLQFDIKFVIRNPDLAEIHEDLSENMRF